MDASAITFSTIKRNKVDPTSSISPLPKQLIVGAGGNLEFLKERRTPLKRLSDLSMKSIQAGRQAYLRQQKQNDEFVYANAASGDFDAVKIAETLSDLIIDDLLEESAKELSDVCDSICENVFEQEFNDPPAQET